MVTRPHGAQVFSQPMIVQWHPNPVLSLVNNEKSFSLKNLKQTDHFYMMNYDKKQTLAVEIYISMVSNMK